MFQLTDQQKKLADQYCRYALQFAASISFGPKGDSLINGSLSNGTITLLRLNSQNLGVTNYHVLQGYRERINAGEDITCQVGNVPIELEARIISGSALMDLVVLDLNGVDPSEIRASSLIPCQFHEPIEWPTKVPNRGEFVLFGGFPGVKRESVGRRSFDFGTFSSGASEVVSVQEDVLTCTISLKQCVTAFDYDGKGLEGLPGISGAPVLASRELESGILVFDLVGVVFEYSEDFDALRTRPTKFIQPNGEIVV